LSRSKRRFTPIISRNVDNHSMTNDPSAVPAGPLPTPAVPGPAVRTLDYYIVDVFTDNALAGNPLAVVINAAQLTTAQMQSIAREFNLSETTFVERRSPAIEEAEGVRVRIFTTEEELPFAGHPTLGTASVLRLTAPETLRNSVITLAENVGPIPVRFPDTDRLSLDLHQSAPPQVELAPPQVKLAPPQVVAEMTQRDPEFGPQLDPAEVARLCGLSRDDLHETASPQVVSTGTGFAIVLLRSVESLGRLRVIQDQASAWLRPQGARWFFVLAPHQDTNGMKCFRARMQFNGGEDPATGSASGCAVSYLVQRGLAPSGQKILILQGVEIGRKSEIFVSANAVGPRLTDIRVGGSTVLVAKGQLFLP
jgi:trans-2,3-dihydro-3-hydroxyanthranilate isomerase